MRLLKPWPIMRRRITDASYLASSGRSNWHLCESERFLLQLQDTSEVPDVLPANISILTLLSSKGRGG